MSNLLSSGFYKIKKDPLFRITLIASVVIGIVFTLCDIDFYDDMFLVPIHILIAVFVSLACGREYSDGTIRNKVISGHNKGKIYLAALILNYGIVLLISAIFVLIHVVMRVTVFPIASVFTVGDWLLAAVNYILGCFVYTALFTLVSMLVTNKALGAIINFALIIVIMFASYQVEFELCQPQFYEVQTYEPIILTAEEIDQIHNGVYQGLPYQIEIMDDDEVRYFTEKVTISTEQNPRYVSNGLLRTFYKACDLVSPHGQINSYVSYLTSGIQHTNQSRPVLDEEQANLVSTMPLYSVSAIILLTTLGWLLFRKKELK